MTELDSRQRQHLKGLAHHLKPVVHIGKDGLSPQLLKQIEGALLDHELIKVKLGESSPLDRKAAQEQLPAATGAAFVQNVGKVFVLYRPHPENPRIDVPASRRDEDEASDDLSMGLPGSVRQRGFAASTPAPAPRRDDRDRDRGPRRTAPPRRSAPSRPSRPRNSARTSGRRGRGRPR